MRISRIELCEMLAEKLTEAVDLETLVRVFYESEFAAYEIASYEDLKSDAIDLGIIDKDEELVIV